MAFKYVKMCNQMISSSTLPDFNCELRCQQKFIVAVIFKCAVGELYYFVKNSENQILIYKNKSLTLFIALQIKK